MAETSNC